MNEAAVRNAFRKQAEWARKLGSPFVALLCDILARDLDGSTATGRRVRDEVAEKLKTPVAMLDAAADEKGRAVIKGVGDRYATEDASLVRYWIANPLL